MKNPVISPSGNKCWCNDGGFFHREDGPAVEWYDGTKSWWYNGVWIGSSKNGFTQDDFDRYLHGLKIGEIMKNPVISPSGNKYWCNNKGSLHREDGPAIEYDDGCRSWWYNGEWVGASHLGFTQEDFYRYLRSLKIKEYW